MHKVCECGKQEESIIYKEWTRCDNKEQRTSEAKQQNTLEKEECFIKKQRMLQLSKRNIKVKTCAECSKNNYENGDPPWISKWNELIKLSGPEPHTLSQFAFALQFLYPLKCLVRNLINDVNNSDSIALKVTKSRVILKNKFKLFLLPLDENKWIFTIWPLWIQKWKWKYANIWSFSGTSVLVFWHFKQFWLYFTRIYSCVTVRWFKITFTYLNERKEFKNSGKNDLLK